MARDVSDDTYYMSTGGKIPVVWTAPEVSVVNIVLKDYQYMDYISLSYCILGIMGFWAFLFLIM